MTDRQGWDAMALELGLQVRWGGIWRRPPMRGRHRGRVVRVRVLDPGEARSNARATEICTWPRDEFPKTLLIVPERSSLRLGEKLGISDTRLGDEVLDALVTVVFSDPDHAREMLLVPYLRDVLVDLFRRHEHIEVRDGAVFLEKLGVPPDAEVLREWLDALSYLLDSLEAAVAGWSFEFPDSLDDGSLPHTGEIRSASPMRRPTQAYTGELNMVAAFQRRVRIATLAGMVPAVGGLLLLVTGVLYGDTPLLRLPGYAWSGTGLLAVLAGLTVFLLTYRCPVCDRIPFVLGHEERSAFPANCPHCGARLE